MWPSSSTSEPDFVWPSTLICLWISLDWSLDPILPSTPLNPGHHIETIISHHNSAQTWHFFTTKGSHKKCDQGLNPIFLTQFFYLNYFWTQNLLYQIFFNSIFFVIFFSEKKNFFRTTKFLNHKFCGTRTFLNLRLWTYHTSCKAKMCSKFWGICIKNVIFWLFWVIFDA